MLPRSQAIDKKVLYAHKENVETINVDPNRLLPVIECLAREFQEHLSCLVNPVPTRAFKSTLLEEPLYWGRNRAGEVQVTGGIGAPRQDLHRCAADEYRDLVLI
ncbi:MAG: hypothetical protein K8R59_06505 [Thermoanaerobaculales bacterium]|nr:hypothetical protein [Thermoanaerobaculales bacterium]